MSYSRWGDSWAPGSWGDAWGEVTEGVNNLAADNLTTGAPTFGEPTVEQVHGLSTNDLISGSPVLDTPTEIHIHTLDANGLLSGIPVFSPPVLGQVDDSVITPVQPEAKGGGGYIEQPPEQHPFRLIETKAIVVPIRKPDIIVKVSMEELYVEAKHTFTKYNKIRIMFQGIE